MTTKFKDKEYKLTSKLISVGEQLKFEATDLDFEPITFENFEKTTVISIFPSINTKVCDLQTTEVIELSRNYKNIRFISISLDLPSALAEWAEDHKDENMEFVSDYRMRDFGIKSGFLIDEIFLLNRGFIILDANGKVLEVDANNDVHQQINFEKLKELVEKYSKQ